MKNLLKLLAVTVVLALVALAWTFSPATLPLAELADASLPAASPPPEMTLSALPTGAMESQAAFAFRGGSIGEAREFGMTAYLVHHPRGDVLIDTGFGREVDAHARTLPALMRATSSYRKGTPVADQLAAQHFDTAKLAVLLTHAHWDHVSGLPDLKGVPVLLPSVERGFIDSDLPMSHLAHSFGALAYRNYGFDGGPYLGFPASHDLFGDGALVIVPAPGHTPGSVIVFLALPSGARYAFLGDLVWQREGVELPAERPWLSRQLVDFDAAGVRANLERVAAIHRRFPQLVMVPAHDARAAAELPTFPATKN